MTTTDMQTGARLPRVGLIDTVRGAALVAMATYHFTWDMEFMGYLAPGTAESGWLKLYARAIATTFLFIVGVSLVLASSPAIRWPSYWKRLGMVVAAAAVISAGTRYFMPGEWIFFGILHCIAVVSLIGIVFLRLPLTATVVATLLVIAAWIADTFVSPGILHSSAFDHPSLYWIGLSTVPMRSNDYVPLFPWITPFLVGLSLARIALRTRLLQKLAVFGPAIPPLAWTGRHSLAFYLVHQPVLFSIAYGLSLVVTPTAGWLSQCESSCSMQNGVAICRSFCQCTLDGLTENKLLTPLQRGTVLAEDERVQTIARQCTPPDAQ